MRRLGPRWREAGVHPDSLFGGEAFERGVDERRRLEYQFELLREDFDLWFDAALRLAGLRLDPAGATWSVLDAGCGEGLFTHEIAHRYPRARVVGFDVDARAVAVAGQRCARQPNVALSVHAPIAAPFELLLLMSMPCLRMILKHACNCGLGRNPLS